MTSALHNQYLQTLGIVQYVPRDLPLVSIVAQPAAVNEQAKLAASEINFDGAIETGTAAAGLSATSTPESLEAMTKSMAELSSLNLGQFYTQKLVFFGAPWLFWLNS